MQGAFDFSEDFPDTYGPSYDPLYYNASELEASIYDMPMGEGYNVEGGNDDFQNESYWLSDNQLMGDGGNSGELIQDPYVDSIINENFGDPAFMDPALSNPAPVNLAQSEVDVNDPVFMSMIDPALLDPALSNQAPVNLAQSEADVNDPVFMGMIDPALLDPALSNQAPVNLAPSEAGIDDPAFMGMIDPALLDPALFNLAPVNLAQSEASVNDPAFMGLIDPALSSPAPINLAQSEAIDIDMGNTVEASATTVPSIQDENNWVDDNNSEPETSSSTPLPVNEASIRSTSLALTPSHTTPLSKGKMSKGSSSGSRKSRRASPRQMVPATSSSSLTCSVPADNPDSEWEDDLTSNGAMPDIGNLLRGLGNTVPVQVPAPAPVADTVNKSLESGPKKMENAPLVKPSARPMKIPSSRLAAMKAKGDTFRAKAATKVPSVPAPTASIESDESDESDADDDDDVSPPLPFAPAPVISLQQIMDNAKAQMAALLANPTAAVLATSSPTFMPSAKLGKNPSAINVGAGETSSSLAAATLLKLAQPLEAPSKQVATTLQTEEHASDSKMASTISQKTAVASDLNAVVPQATPEAPTKLRLWSVKGSSGFQKKFGSQSPTSGIPAQPSGPSLPSLLAAPLPAAPLPVVTLPPAPLPVAPLPAAHLPIAHLPMALPQSAEVVDNTLASTIDKPNSNTDEDKKRKPEEAGLSDSRYAPMETSTEGKVAITELGFKPAPMRISTSGSGRGSFDLARLRNSMKSKGMSNSGTAKSVGHMFQGIPRPTTLDTHFEDGNPVLTGNAQGSFNFGLVSSGIGSGTQTAKEGFNLPPPGSISTSTGAFNAGPSKSFFGGIPSQIKRGGFEPGSSKGKFTFPPLTEAEKSNDGSKPGSSKGKFTFPPLTKAEKSNDGFKPGSSKGKFTFPPLTKAQKSNDNSSRAMLDLPDLNSVGTSKPSVLTAPTITITPPSLPAVGSSKNLPTAPPSLPVVPSVNTSKGKSPPSFPVVDYTRNLPTTPPSNHLTVPSFKKKGKKATPSRPAVDYSRNLPISPPDLPVGQSVNQVIQKSAPSFPAAGSSKAIAQAPPSLPVVAPAKSVTESKPNLPVTDSSKSIIQSAPSFPAADSSKTSAQAPPSLPVVAPAKKSHAVVQEITALKEELKREQKLTRVLKTKLENEKESAESLQSKLDSEKETAQLLTTQLDKEKKSVESLKDELSHAIKKGEDYREWHREEKERSDDYQKKHASEQRRADGMLKTIKRQATTAKEKGCLVDSLERKNAEQRNLLRDPQYIIDGLQAQVDRQSFALENANTLIDEQESILQEFKEKLEGLQDTIRSKDRKIKALDEELDDLDREFEKESAKIVSEADIQARITAAVNIEATKASKRERELQLSIDERVKKAVDEYAATMRQVSVDDVNDEIQAGIDNYSAQQEAMIDDFVDTWGVEELEKVEEPTVQLPTKDLVTPDTPTLVIAIQQVAAIAPEDAAPVVDEFVTSVAKPAKGSKVSKVAGAIKYYLGCFLAFLTFLLGYEEYISLAMEFVPDNATSKLISYTSKTWSSFSDPPAINLSPPASPFLTAWETANILLSHCPSSSSPFFVATTTGTCHLPCLHPACLAPPLPAAQTPQAALNDLLNWCPVSSAPDLDDGEPPMSRQHPNTNFLLRQAIKKPIPAAAAQEYEYEKYEYEYGTDPVFEPDSRRRSKLEIAYENGDWIGIGMCAAWYAATYWRHVHRNGRQ